MTNQLKNKTLDEELKERLTSLQKNKGVSPWYWAEKIEKMDDPMEEFVGDAKAFEDKLDFAFSTGATFVFENKSENGKLKKFRYICGHMNEMGCTFYHVEKKILKNGQEAMYLKIKLGNNYDIEATQTKDGDFVGHFDYKSLTDEVSAFYDENKNGVGQQELLHGKITVGSGNILSENHISGVYAHGMPKKIKRKVANFWEDRLQVSAERYKNGQRVYGYDHTNVRHGQNDVIESFYDEGILISQKHMGKVAHDVIKTAKILAWVSLGAAVCLGTAHVVGSQKAVPSVQKQYQRG